MTNTITFTDSDIERIHAEHVAQVENAENQERIFVDALVTSFDVLGMNHPVTLFADRFCDKLVDLLHGAGEQAWRDHEFNRGWDQAKGEF